MTLPHIVANINIYGQLAYWGAARAPAVHGAGVAGVDANNNLALLSNDSKLVTVDTGAVGFPCMFLLLYAQPKL